MFLSGERNMDWSPGEKFQRICTEITLEAVRRGGLSKITVRNLCRCPQIEESLLIYLTCTLFHSTLPDRFLGCNWAKVENSMS